MYHTKELENLAPRIQNNEPPVAEKDPANDKTPTLSKIRFGELEVGDRFVFDGCWLVKTGEYAAETDCKRGKRSYLFFKKDVVKEEKVLLHEDGSVKPTKFLEPKSNRSGKHDLFGDHSEILKPWTDYAPPKPQCEIVITPGDPANYKANLIEVTDKNGYYWTAYFEGAIGGSWSVPIKLWHYVQLTLMYDGQNLYLYYKDKEVWKKSFDSWAGVHCCTIVIRDVQIEPEDV